MMPKMARHHLYMAIRQKHRETRGPAEYRGLRFGADRQRDPGVAFSSLVQEILQDGFGIDSDEFFPQDAIQQIHVAGMDAVAVVHHCEVTDPFGMEMIDRPHHVERHPSSEPGVRRCRPPVSSRRSYVCHHGGKRELCDPPERDVPLSFCFAGPAKKESPVASNFDGFRR